MNISATLNLVGALLICAASAGIVFHKKIHQGFTAGLGLAILSLGALLVSFNFMSPIVEIEPLMGAMNMCFIGMIMALVGISLRILRRPYLRKAMRAITDWGTLDESPTPH